MTDKVTNEVLKKNSNLFWENTGMLNDIFRLLKTENKITEETYKTFEAKLKQLSSTFAHLQDSTNCFDVNAQMFYVTTRAIEKLLRFLDLDDERQVMIQRVIDEQTDCFVNYFKVTGDIASPKVA